VSVQITDYRNISLTIHLYIKNTILYDWVSTEVNSALTLDPKTNLYMPDYSEFDDELNDMAYPVPNDRGRGWIYFDYPDLTNEQTTQVTVRDSGGATLTQNTDYIVNYAHGGVQHIAGNKPYEVDYQYNYIATVEEWRQTNRSSLPIVVVDTGTLNKEGFQLGAGDLNINRGNVYIFGSTKAERDDLLNIIHDAFHNRQRQPQDFADGTPLDFDGTFNTGYNITTLSGALGACATHFDNVIARPLQFNMVNDVNEFRGRVQFEMRTYMN
jgi:hypothetical protein